MLHLILQGVPEDRQSSASSVSSRSSAASGGSSRGGIDVVGLEVEVKGDCAEYDVALTPYAILVPGEVMVSTSTRQQFQVRIIINLRLSNAAFAKFKRIYEQKLLFEIRLLEIQSFKA